MAKGNGTVTQNRIRFKTRSRTFNLSAIEIDEASEWLVENLAEANADKSDCLRMRLLLEEALLNMAEHYGEQSQVNAYLERRQGRFRLRVVVEGSRFNPLKPEGETEEDLSASLFKVIDLRVQYSYSMGSNVVRISMPRKSMNPVLKIMIAIAVGAAVGILGNVAIPNELQETFSNAVLSPIANMWVRLLQAISGPIIFLTALTATFGTKRIADFGGSRISTLARYVIISTVVVLFTLACSRPFFPLDIAATHGYSTVLSNSLDGVLQIVPGNLIEPFITANTLQLLLIAIVTGYLLAALESQVKDINALISQLNTLGLTVAQHACEVVPFFVGLLLCLKLWTHDMDLLGSIWLPLVLSTAFSAVVFLIGVLAASARFHVSPRLLALKFKGPFVDALRRGTLDFSAVDDLAAFCKNQLGIDGEFARATLPQGLFLYMPTSAIGICVFVLFAAQTQGVPVDQAWYAAAAALSVVLAVATPPMTGANLLSFVVAFSYLGISSDVYLDVMVFDIVFGVLCIAFDQAMLQIETIFQADHMGFLDEDALRMPR